MMERLKSGVLMMLILLSLLQSYLLAYSYPKFDPVRPDEYVKTDLNGPQTALEDLLFPDQLVLHLGNQQHTVAYPTSKVYNDIVDNIKQRSLEGFRKTTTTSLGINWDEVRSKQQGVEVRFRDGLPFSVLQQQKVMQIKGDIPVDNDLITRIWIFAKDTNEVKTILFTDTGNTIYEVQKADFTPKDMERYFANVGTDYVPYKMSNIGDYYLPTKPITIPSYTIGYTQYTADQLKRSFFVDPAVTRNLTERDGSEIYMDGKRGLQLKNEQHWMTYTDPIAPADSKIDLRENLVSAVQFINQHGGWNGTYALQKLPQRLLPSNQSFVFRQYYGAYPVVNLHNDYTGFIKVVLQKGVVSNLERSTLTPDSRNARRKDVQLIGGEELDEKLKQWTSKTPVYGVFPGYRTVVLDQTMELVPGWMVELRDGTYELLE
ncbi:two-component system activity regulator YycH [Paenibacillus filicis]|uniref:Two-component system activity regulator YycH n=1 Tax=Paenibacillus gyeongsangnamensis TaxID=3388067 RepID=A0ABT4QL89_9BACL|nr:two-component system activity regulator YycH [Paenibacillus filicis]MCZ8517632.1 two-component system activity regulator YycH [Paenibacillus filicis]